MTPAGKRILRNFLKLANLACVRAT
jgi:hypothetical protein